MQTFADLFEQAQSLKKANKHDQALGILTYIQLLSPDSLEGINAAVMLSSLYKDLGLMEEAYSHIRGLAERLEEKKNYAVAESAYSSLACGSLYTYGVSLPTYATLTSRLSVLAESHVAKVSHLNHDFTVGRRLKVGILSPDLCMHSLAYLVAQPLLNFQRITGHELHIYHLRPYTDAVSEKLKAVVSGFTIVHGWDDESITKKIVDDKIDVLLDISGYTAETRLSVFYRQPAPVQMGWISGMMTPTGLKCIPYFITDEYMKPPDVPASLGHQIAMKTALTYHTLRDTEIPVEGLPFDRNGYISFASFNNPCKINSEVLTTWAQILRRTPKSKLHLKTYHPLDEARIHKVLTGLGVPAERLVLIPHLPSSTDVQIYYNKNVDIFLDAWPCSGCLTTIEALWMGVPVVSCYSDLFCSRQSHSILNNLGISDLSHPTISGYIDAAVNLAYNPTRVRKMRKDLRGIIAASPLQNYGNTVVELGKAIVAAWEQTVTSRNNTLDLLRKAA